MYSLFSGDEPFVLFDAVQRNKRHEDRHGLHILLVFGIRAVVFVLADFQPARAGEHDIGDQGIAQRHQRPLPAGHGADAADDCARPEEHLAQIIRAADKAIQAGIHEAAGIDFLGAAFLKIGFGLHPQAEGHDRCAEEDEDVVLVSAEDPIEHGRRLQDIQHGAGDPDGDLHAEGNAAAFLDFALHVLLVGADPQFAEGQVAAKAQAIGNQQQAEQQRAKADALTQEEKEQAFTRDGEAVADGEKPDIVLEADGADQHGCQKQPEKLDGKCHVYSSRLIVLCPAHIIMLCAAMTKSIINCVRAVNIVASTGKENMGSDAEKPIQA